MTIGERIKQLREDRGWSQDELAKRMGYSTRSSICYIESGRNEVTATKLMKFAQVFCCSPAEILGKNRPLSDEDLALFEEICMDNALHERLLAYARKLKEIKDAKHKRFSQTLGEGHERTRHGPYPA